MISTSISTSPSDEIDLHEVACTLWQRKGTIITITIISTVFAAAYAYVATPIYQASVNLLPPPASALIGFNALAQEVGLPPGMWNKPRLAPNAAQRFTVAGARSITLSPEDAHELLIGYLESKELQGQFQQGVRENEDLVSSIPLTIAVRQPASLNERQSTQLTLQSKQPEHLADLTNQYIQLATQAAQHELNLGLNAGLKIKQQQLRQELVLAQAVNKALPSSEQDTAQSITVISLQAQLNQLEKSPEITLAVPTYAVDTPATIPTSPIKPKKKLIIALGLVLGGMLGSFLVLLQHAFHRSDNHH